jgi:hypothetical protein
MYEVAIHAPDEHFLHWDKPLSEQHSHVRKALTKLGLPDYDEETSLADEKLLAALNGPANTSSPSHPANLTGKQVHGKLVEDLHLGRNPAKPFKQSHADIASRLLSAGIPGIKYLDQGSRGAGQGTHNYVVFDPRHVETVRRYAKGGLVYHGHIPGHFAAGGFEPPHMRQPQQIMADIRSVGNIPGRAADVSKAMTMRARQTPPEEVFRQTGVFAPVEPTPGSFSPPHEYLRAEIPDTAADLTTKARAIIAAKAHGTKAKLGDVLEHPELYQAYPHLANTDVHFEDLKPHFGGYYQPPVGTLSAKNLGKIALNSNRDPDRLRRIALHEAQHLIQELHGFPVGSSLGAVESDPTLRAEAKKRKQDILDKELTPYSFVGFLAHLNHLGNPENANLSPAELQKLHQEYLFEHEYERKRPDTVSPMVDAATKIANFRTYQNVPGERESRAVEHRSEIYPSDLRSVHPKEHYFDDSEAAKDQSQGLGEQNLKFMKDFLSRSAADHSTHHATIRWRAQQAAKGAPYRSAGGSVDDALRIVREHHRAGEVVGEVAKKVTRPRKPVQTVRDPVRNAYPGIYGNPREIVAEAASRVAPENDMMKRLFGVTREELYEIGKNRKGNAEPKIATSAKPRGSAAAEKVMLPKNEQRLIDILAEANKHRPLQVGMDAWYVMDPAYRRLEQLIGPEAAKARYDRLNHVVGMMSPGSEVGTEIARGTAADYLINQGRFGDFEKYAGMAESARGKDFPKDIRRVPGHAYHKTSQVTPLRDYLRTGKLQMQSPKVPLYIQASGVPQTGFQTKLPVPDAHFTRALGTSDVRTDKDYAASMSMPEHQQLGPWFRDKIAKKVGLEAVPAQARLWGAASGQTGVTTPIGAPKLELLTQHILNMAQHHGITPEEARDHVLLGTKYAGGGFVDDAHSSNVVDDAMRIASQYKPRGRP